jgi:hypothetical protein
MPIKLIPPRERFSPYYYGRGTYLGVFVNRSTKADRVPIAKRVIKQWEHDIERGRFATDKGPTFLSASVSYMQAGGERTYVAKLIGFFGETPLSEIDQAAVDCAAVALYPQASNATRNRSVYTPISAILRHAGKGFDLRRPKDAQGRQLTGWLTEEQAFALLAAAIELDIEFGVFCTILLYTGCRLSEPLKVRCADVNLSGAEMFVPTTKNGEPRRVFLPVTPSPIIRAGLPGGLIGFSASRSRVRSMACCAKPPRPLALLCQPVRRSTFFATHTPLGFAVTPTPILIPLSRRAVGNRGSPHNATCTWS